MKQTNTPHRRALAALLSATAFVAIPAFAQEATPAAPADQVTPVTPPVVPVVPDTAPAAYVTQASPAKSGSSATPVDPAAAAQAAAEDVHQRADRAVAHRPATRQAEPVHAARSQPAAPVIAPVTGTPAPIAPTPVAATPEVTPPAPTASAASADPAPATTADAATTSTTTVSSGMGIWPFLLAGLGVLAAAGFFLLRRRNMVSEETWVEPTYVAEPVAVAPVAPVMLDRMPSPVNESTIAAAPAVPEHAIVTHAAEEDVAALTAAAPVGDRPWLEFAMRPVRAGTNADEALVEIELTVGNAGEVAAHDVRISTFMLDRGDDSRMEHLLLNPPVGADVEPVTIDPGEGTRVDATLALLKAELTTTSFSPIVVADARYRLADGSEGRTSASFLIGVTEEGTTTLSPIDTARPLMRDDIEARLFREPQHA